MSRYRKVDLRIWGDERVRRLSAPKPNGRDCWLYLLTAKETIILPGAIPAGAGALAESLRWPTSGFREAFAEIEGEGMAVADWISGLIWIPNAVRYNAPENPNVAKAWGKAVDLLPDCDLRLRIISDVEAFLKPLKEAFLKAFREGLGERFGKSGAGAGAGAEKLLDPSADFGSGEPRSSPQVSPQPVEFVARGARQAHWEKVADQIATWMVCKRDLDPRTKKKSRQVDLDNVKRWAVEWCLKEEPDEAQLEQMRRTFTEYLDDPEVSHDLSVWCSERVWLNRWHAVRLRDGEGRPRPRKVS